MSKSVELLIKSKYKEDLKREDYVSLVTETVGELLEAHGFRERPVEIVVFIDGHEVLRKTREE